MKLSFLITEMHIAITILLKQINCTYWWWWTVCQSHYNLN